MTTKTISKIKTTRRGPGKYLVSINNVPCFDVDQVWNGEEYRWVSCPRNLDCDWRTSDNRKKDAIRGIEMLIACDGADHVIEFYGAR